jgi:hypothetical protein
MKVILGQWKRWIKFNVRAALELSLRPGNREGGFVRAKKSAPLRKVGSNSCTTIWIIPVSLLVFMCELHVHIIVN